MKSPGPVRVLHLINGLSGGGLERWLWDIVRLSSPDQVEHRVVTIYPDLGGAPIYDELLRARGVLEPTATGLLARASGRALGHARVHRDHPLVRRGLAFPLRVAANALALRRIARAFATFRPDVVHAHSGPDVIVGVLARMFLRKPLVHTVPCLFSQMEDAGFHWLPSLYARCHRWIDRFSTGEARSELLSVGVPEWKILYDLGGVDLAAISQAVSERDRHRAELRARLGVPADAPIALTLGRLHSSKGHLFAIEAMPELLRAHPDLQLVVVGEGAEREALTARARELAVADRTHLIGYVRDPFPVLAAGDVYLRTTVFEPENLSFYQAMAAGLPAVGFETGWPDLIEKVGHGSVVPNGDPAALAAAALAILSRPDRGRSLGELARRYASEHLDVRHSVLLLTSVYATLSARHHDGPAAGAENHPDVTPGIPGTEGGRKPDGSRRKMEARGTNRRRWPI